jgi:hypothetical protein
LVAIEKNSIMLKIRFVLIIILLGQLSLNAQTFDVSIDTLFLDVKNIARPASRIDLTHAVKLENNYYCFFEEQGLYGFKLETKYFLVISDKGKILNNIEVPKEIENTVYFDFFIRNGSLFAKTYMDHESFKFDFSKLTWTKIKEVDDRVYEDSNFAITYLDFGEWGQTTWFIDKQTKKEYILGVNGTTVNKLNGNYYLTGGTVVRIIENPRQLKQSDKKYYYRQVEKERKFHEGATSLLGSYTIYKDTTYSPWSFEEPKEYIITSFVANDNLVQLYSDSIQTYIGRIENQKLIPIQVLGKKYQSYNWHYSYRGKNLDNSSRFIKLRENNNTYGFIEINNNQVDIHYLIHNQDSLKHSENDGFSSLFRMLLDRPDSFSMEMADSLEDVLKGTDMKDYRTNISHNGYYPKIYSTQEIKTTRFIKVENNYLAQETEYLKTVQDNLVKSIFIEWTETEQYNQSNSFNFFNDDKTEIEQQFLLKMREIEKTITENSNIKPQKEDRGNDYIKLTWNLENGIKIKLYGSENFKGAKEIRMIIDLE